MKRVYTYTVTGAVAVAASCAIADEIRIYQIDVHFSSAPTTSQSMTFTINSNAGAAYDTLVYTVNPSTTSMTNLHLTEGGYQSPLPVILVKGDSLDIAFANTDARTIGISVYYEV